MGSPYMPVGQDVEGMQNEVELRKVLVGQAATH